MTSQALVPGLLQSVKAQNVRGAEVLGLFVGVALISLLAQIAIPLPWTPVPITGQTLGVSLVALSWGARRAALVLLVYVLLGSLGAPIFALGKSGFMWGPTSGYLVGMVIASGAMGWLADRGMTHGFWSSLAAAYAGSFLTLGLGVWVLSYFVPSENLLLAGLWPFLPGDLIKNTLAALTSWGLRRSI